MKTLTKDNHKSILKELEEAKIDFTGRPKRVLSDVTLSKIVFGTLGGSWYIDPKDDFMSRWIYGKHTLIKLNSFTFIRDRKCWKVCGYVPLYISEEMYRDSRSSRRLIFQRKTIRPRDSYFGKKYKCNVPSKNIACYKVCDMDVVRHHYIYTQESLNYFVEVLKKYNLV